MKATSSGQRVRKMCSNHDLMLERLRSLDNCLEDIFYHGEVCSDLRGFGGLRQRCQELQKTLQQHIPEGEKVFLEVKEDSQVCPLLGELVEDHRDMLRALEQSQASRLLAISRDALRYQMKKFRLEEVKEAPAVWLFLPRESPLYYPRPWRRFGTSLRTPRPCASNGLWRGASTSSGFLPATTAARACPRTGRASRCG